MFFVESHAAPSMVQLSFEKISSCSLLPPGALTPMAYTYDWPQREPGHGAEHSSDWISISHGSLVDSFLRISYAPSLSPAKPNLYASKDVKCGSATTLHVMSSGGLCSLYHSSTAVLDELPIMQ